jgi:hypothetical protein
LVPVFDFFWNAWTTHTIVAEPDRIDDTVDIAAEPQGQLENLGAETLQELGNVGMATLGDDRKSPGALPALALSPSS